ncbi:TadE/TadG family type IV pilus assembly protein [Inquilinus sp. OTU3971]|uniref:TadE/TadG family type IV pilus assembly protein n=1 Tax=Inquilinus sp. OTU3971 TaxID=3043855 RepID=UPI00313ED2D8
MRPRNHSAGRLLRNQTGAAAVEFAIIGMALIVLMLGLIEVGRGLYLRNALAQAVDVGARNALVHADMTDTALEDQVRAAFTGSEPDLLQVTVGTETVDGITFRTVALSYPLTLLVPGLAGTSTTLGMTRRIPTP